MAKSKEELIYDIENELVDLTTNKITGDRVKARLLDMVDAMGEGGGSQLEYWEIPEDVSEAAGEMTLFAFIIKGQLGEQTQIMPCGYAYILGESFKTTAIAIDRNARYLMPGEDAFMSLGEMFDESGFTLEDFGMVLIDEETFYTI